jgi:hypothetical protein
MRMLKSGYLAFSNHICDMAYPTEYDLYKHFDRLLSKKCMHVKNSMPCEVKDSHICTCSGKSVTEVVLPVIKQMARREHRLRLCILRSIAACSCANGNMPSGVITVEERPLLPKLHVPRIC